MLAPWCLDVVASDELTRVFGWKAYTAKSVTVAVLTQCGRRMGGAEEGHLRDPVPGPHRPRQQRPTAEDPHQVRCQKSVMPISV